MKTRDMLIAEAREILDLWTSSWSEAKWKRWNDVMGKDTPLNPELVIEKAFAKLREADRVEDTSDLTWPLGDAVVRESRGDGRVCVRIENGALTAVYLPAGSVRK